MYKECELEVNEEIMTQNGLDGRTPGLHHFLMHTSSCPTFLLSGKMFKYLFSLPIHSAIKVSACHVEMTLWNYIERMTKDQVRSAQHLFNNANVHLFHFYF